MTLIQNLQRIIGMKGSKTEISALTGDLSEFTIAFSTGTNELGVKIDNIWNWYGTGTSAVNTDEKVKISSNDTTAGYLNGKIIEGAGISLTEVDDGGDETFRISYTGTNCGTYQRIAQPIPLFSVTGTAWVVPGYVFASGSLALFSNGSLLTPVIDYFEHIYVSGTYILNTVYPIGTTFVAMWGVPCTLQTFISTGSSEETHGILDSNSVQILDSNDAVILDSAG